MMSSQTAQTFVDPVFKSKMPLFDGTVTSAGRSKPPNMSGFLSKQALQYSGAYFAFDPRGKDGAGFVPWAGSKTCLLDGRSPVSHLSPHMEGQSHVVYRQDQDAKSSEERHSHSPSVRHTPGKQAYSYYAGPGTASPTVITPPAVRKQISGGGNSSSPSENSVYLAIPKPIYVHSPCCNAMGCVFGQRYSVERGCQRIPNTVYESEWMPSGAQYAQRPHVQRKAPDAGLQQRGLHYETNAEQSPQTYCSLSPGRARALPTYIDSNYSGYPCTPPRTMLGPLSEQSQHLQTPPRSYHSLYPSHPTYEHMTSDIYQARSPMSKYGQLTQRPVFYYPQASVEVESRTQCKDTGGKKREDVPVILKTPQEHYIPQSIHGEIPLSSTDTLSNHSLMQGFDYSCYAGPRIALSASQIRDPLKKQHAPPSIASDHIDVSPSHHHMAGPLSSANLHRGHLKAGRLFDPPYPSPPFLHADQPSSSKHLDPPAVGSPASGQINQMFSPLGSLHVDRPRPSPVGLNIDRLLNYSPRETQVTLLKEPQSLVPDVWSPHSPNHIADSMHRAVTNNANVRKIIYSPVAVGGKEHNPSAFSLDTTVLRRSLKRSPGHLSPSVKIKDENLCELGQIKKRCKVELDVVKVEDENDSPPMPVIDNVFSLAAYKGYLQTPGALLPVKAHQRNVQSPELKRPDRDGQQPHTCLTSKQICPDTSTHRSVIQILEPKNIKVEKVDPQDTDNSVESHSPSETDQEDCIKTLVKTEGNKNGSSDNVPMLVINKCEPELESRVWVAVKDETVDVSKAGEQTAETGSESSFHGDACLPRDEVETPQPVTPLQPPKSKLSFRNIPPQCLKLSTFNITLPDSMHSSSTPAPMKPPVLLVDKLKPKFEFHMPVRKHFFELHQSLCKLVFKSVLVSSEQDLRTWLSQLNMTEHTSPSAKVQKVSCLLGAKAREMWLNEEIHSALQKVLERLREYTAQGRCPFPLVMRTGAVFIPMLVLKELLFPHVQSSFIDQVLQEHKVELRPTTLSEEKILIQLHKRACSSKLRRLMSLKHLPEVYADVVNLFHHASVCKHLGLNTDGFVHREPDEGCEETAGGCRSPAFPDDAASPASGPDPQRSLEDQQTKSHLNNRRKSRVKSSSRRTFLSDTLSDEEEEAVYTEITGNGGVLSTFYDKSCIDHQSEGTENRGSDHMVAEDSSHKISDVSWTSPLTADEMSSSASDTETEETTIPRSGCHSLGAAKYQDGSKKCSGMILKLRRIIFSEGLNRKKTHYQAVSDSGTISDPCISQTEDRPGPIRRTSRTGTLSHSSRPLCSASKRQHRSLLKIKYCPYLSACHSAEHRKRWVLRSAVHRARGAMRTNYPDLVGKRILHLYEEDDKSEVWYKGEVLGIHEAHPNPLNTIFEVRYDSEPEWKYYLELLVDYEKGWLKIED